MSSQTGLDFVKPVKRGPIAIINPESRTEVPVVPSKVSTTIPAQSTAFAELKKGKPKKENTDKSHKKERPLQVNGVNEAQEAQEVNSIVSLNGHRLAPASTDGHVPGFDVYATPYVPQILKVISHSSGTVIATPPLRPLALAEYGHAVLGRLLLPPVFGPMLLDPSAPPQSCIFTNGRISNVFNPSAYEPFFGAWLEAEILHQQRENETYSLYQTTGKVVCSVHLGPATCTISVPGLREYSPYVEEDDVVELRLLNYDFFSGRLTNMPYDSIPWNRTIYRARVSAVIRAKEELVLQAQGLVLPSGHPTPGTPTELKFNVQFPVPDDRYLPMRLVLAQIQAALTAAAANTQRVADASVRNVKADDFHYWVQSMLFPTEADCDLQANLHTGRFNSQEFLDKDLNFEQMNAVENVCLQNYGTVPYLISGPPGTGKTKTLIETALQLLRNVGDVCHILICAPSEPATDTLADRLRHHLAPHELLRLNRPNRTFGEVPSQLLPYCYMSSNTFALPPFRELMKYRVVVTSCRDASLLMYSRMTNSDLSAVEQGLQHFIHPLDPDVERPIKLHWTAVLLDEAAQALEPEALLPLFVVSPPIRSQKLKFTPLVVMAGDECQLGPRTSSPKTPLKRSLFARLFSRPVYANHPLARGKRGEAPPPLTKSMLPILRPPFTNLIRNYRSHPAILAVPSALFYFDTLEAMAGRQNNNINIDRLASWTGWRGKPGWPVLFHNNKSPDDLERDGAGWYNAGEAAVAVQYASSLVSFLGGPACQREVCVMSPFKSQVRLLRERLRRASLYDVNCGPTEAFQGLEHGVVILCVTRANKRFVAKDVELSWGIVGQPNKMNVALTRAKFGLIIVGDRDVLVDDPHWRAVLDFCYRNGLVAGDGRGEEFEYREEPLTRFEAEMSSAENGTGVDGGGLRD